MTRLGVNATEVEIKPDGNYISLDFRIEDSEVEELMKQIDDDVIVSYLESKGYTISED